MPLYTKCMKCGGWKDMPEQPTAKNHVPTGMMMTLSKPPTNVCKCTDDADVEGNGEK